MNRQTMTLQKLHQEIMRVAPSVGPVHYATREIVAVIDGVRIPLGKFNCCISDTGNLVINTGGRLLAEDRDGQRWRAVMKLFKETNQAAYAQVLKCTADLAMQKERCGFSKKL